MAAQRRIFLATDLSARCDRAFDRAIQLAREWSARLTIATALEDWPQDADAQPRWRQIDSELIDAERQIESDLAGTDVEADSIIRRGWAPDVMSEIALERPWDLIVTGIARHTGFTRQILGATVERLLRTQIAPVLVVKRRVQGAYGNALVGTDLSDGSRTALERTSELFPRAALTVLHAYRETLPLGNLAGEPEGGDAHRLAHDECARFVAQTLPGVAESVKCVAAVGFAETLLNQYAIDKNVDLMAVGTRGRNSLIDILFGSTCRSLILTSPRDLLIVPSTQR